MILLLKIYLRKFKFAMHNVFLFDLYKNRHFVGMLNLRAIEFLNISENKVLVNNT